MENESKKFLKIVFIFIIVFIFVFCESVLAEEIVSKVDFHNYVASGGDYVTIMDTKRKMEVDYMKVDIDTKDGDKYDVRFKYSKDWLTTKKTLAVKKGLLAKGKKSTIYFIPKKEF